MKGIRGIIPASNRIRPPAGDDGLREVRSAEPKSAEKQVALKHHGVIFDAGWGPTDRVASDERSVIVAVSGYPSWDDVPLERLRQREGAAQSVMEAYRAKGEEFLGKMRGTFAIAVYDAARKSVLLATDRMGIEPLFYFASGDSLSFGSTADQVLAGLDHKPELDPQSIYNYVYFHVVPGPRTVYKGISRLPQGACLVWRDGRAIVRTYAPLVFREHQPVKSRNGLEREFREILARSVRVAATAQPCGAFLSGGTDSSTVAGLLSSESGRPARAYSIGFDADGYDEMEYARIAARHFGLEHRSYYVTPEDVADAVPKVAAFYDQPFGNASAVPAYYCARMAREDGMAQLLAGDGGDELFAGNARYAKQKVFEQYHRLPKPLRNRLIEPLLFGVLGKARFPPLRKTRSYVSQANTPLPDRLESYNLLDNFGIERVFTSDFFAEIDTGTPMSLLEETYHTAHAEDIVNRMLAADIRFVLADGDLPKVSRMCELAGIEVGYPLLSDEVVAFAADLPPRLKLKGMRLRYFFKQALRDFLPPETLRKRKQGFGLPFGVWVGTHAGLCELAGDSLTTLKGRRIFRQEFLDDLLTRGLKDHAAYYGVMVWILMMFEQWMSSHENGAGQAG